MDYGETRRERSGSLLQRDQKCSCNSVAVSITTTKPSIFSFTQPSSLIPPIFSSSYTVILSHSPINPLASHCSPHDVINIKASMVADGKAH